MRNQLGIGQSETPAQVAIIFTDAAGVATGWRVFQPSKVTWEMTGVGQQGTEARLVVEGPFHKVAKPGLFVEDADSAVADLRALHQARLNHPSSRVFEDRDDDVIEYEAPKRLGGGPR